MTKQKKHTRHVGRGPNKGRPFTAGTRMPVPLPGMPIDPRMHRYTLWDDWAALIKGITPPKWEVKKNADKFLTYFQLVQHRGYPHSPFGDADKDGVLNIFDRHPLNAGDKHIVPPCIKSGNLKLNTNIGVFSLPRYFTCPGRTPLCTKYCYAEGPEAMRPTVVYSRNKNLAWTLTPDFVRVASETINNKKFDWFRIHESGDFYNQKYLEKWKTIAKNCPNTRFLAYTKNWSLNLKDLPKNLTIRYSCDISSKHIRKELPVCYVGLEHPKNFFKCKMKCEPGFCMACWDKKVDVFIPIHSVSKKAVDHMFFKQFNPDLPLTLKYRKLLPQKILATK